MLIWDVGFLISDLGRLFSVIVDWTRSWRLTLNHEDAKDTKIHKG
jgi:hypothetical protein